MEDKYKKHYTTIKSLSRLLTSMNTKHSGKQHYSTNCLQSFSTEEIRDNHDGYCRNNESVSIAIPTKNPIVEFTNGQRQFKVPFVMYVDFKSILEPIQGASDNTNKSSTRGVNSHKPSGWCLHSKFNYGNIKNPIAQYRGSDCVERFCEHIISEAKMLYKS